jgi:uncharacterized protein (DUF2235 family)
MAKRIVFCADGTWQAPMNGTNVYRLYKMLTVAADQIPHYDDGVGADAKGFDRLVGGAIGEGLVQKVIAGYTTIAHDYEDGDEIFLFGFSRGAYTARSIAGFIANCGLPVGQVDDDCVAKAFQAYRDPDPVSRKARLESLGACRLKQPTIRMVGVWDTVGALGIPAIFGGFDTQQFGFLDTGLHPCIKNAFQCLAIDEQRCQFPATLWSTQSSSDQTVEQVWFSGCHGDVGGGTLAAGGVDDATRLCDITLGWMVAKAQALGLTMDPAAAQQFQNMPVKYALDKINESWNPIYGKPLSRPIPANSSLSNSVGIRVQYGLTYQPANLTYDSGALAAGYPVVDVVDPNII